MDEFTESLPCVRNPKVAARAVDIRRKVPVSVSAVNGWLTHLRALTAGDSTTLFSLPGTLNVDHVGTRTVSKSEVS